MLDLIFTYAVSILLIILAGVAIWLLPWTDAELEATERGLIWLAKAGWQTVRRLVTGA